MINKNYRNRKEMHVVLSNSEIHRDGKLQSQELGMKFM